MNQLYEHHEISDTLEKAQQLAVFLASIDAFEKSKNLLNQLNPLQKIMYIDKNQNFAIVKGKYLKQLIAKSQEGTIKLTKATKQLFNYNNKAAYFQTTLQLTNQQLRKSKHNERILLEQLSQRDFQIKSLAQQLKDKIAQKEYTNMNIQFFKGREGKVKNMIFQKQRNPVSKQYNSQTEYIPLTIDSEVLQMDVEEEKRPINLEKENLDDFELRLVFKKIITELTEKFEEKISEFKLKDEQLNEWKEKFDLITEQNKQLKKRIRDIATQQEKVKIWKESVLKFIDRVEHEYIVKKYSNQKMVEQSQSNMLQDKQERIRKLQRKVTDNQVQRLTHQQKIKKINQILMQQNEQLADQGALNNLLKISVKIRQALKILMESI